MLASDWLFVRGHEFLWVRRSRSATPELVIHGPGNLRRVGSFNSERELRDFETELYARLLHEGWILERCAPNRSDGWRPLSPGSP